MKTITWLGIKSHSYHVGRYFTAWLWSGIKFIRTNNHTEEGRKAIQKYRDRGWWLQWDDYGNCLMYENA